MRRANAYLALALTLAALGLAGCGGPKTLGGSRYRAVRPGVAAAMLRDNPELVVLDVRPFDDYAGAAGHLARALSTPTADLDTLWLDLGLTIDDTVLLYCGDGGQRQDEASAKLIGRGLRFVVQIEGGLEAWLDEGFEVTVEDAPLSPLRRRGSGGQGLSGSTLQ